jgi:hypothetical protein
MAAATPPTIAAMGILCSGDGAENESFAESVREGDDALPPNDDVPDIDCVGDDALLPNDNVPDIDCVGDGGAGKLVTVSPQLDKSAPIPAIA